jgi:phage FluMu protein Com
MNDDFPFVPTDESQKNEAAVKEDLSRQEAEHLGQRQIRCSKCNFLIMQAYSDCRSGHAEIKCQKCKQISVVNFAYFCRRRFMGRERPDSRDNITTE